MHVFQGVLADIQELSVINPRHMCSEGYSSHCVCVCVCVCWVMYGEWEGKWKENG